MTVESVYAASGHLEQVRHATSGHIYWRALSTDARGNVTASRLGNGVEELRAHEDATGFLTSIKSYAPNAGGAIQDLAYTFDRLGNLRRRQDARANLDETFAYDTLNRVVSVATTVPGPGGGSPTTTTVSVTYNRLGNITFILARRLRRFAPDRRRARARTSAPMPTASAAARTPTRPAARPATPVRTPSSAWRVRARPPPIVTT